MEKGLFDTKELVKKFYRFFNENKKKEIKRVINEGLPSLILSMFEISEYDYELVDVILSNPEEVLAIMEETLKQFFEMDEDYHIKIRFKDLPVTERVMIREIRTEDLGRLVLIEGLVRRKTDVRPRLKYIEYLCSNPSCPFSADKIRVPQFDEKKNVLKACPKCKSPVEVLNKVLVDTQVMTLEEIPEQLKNSSDQPKRIKVILQDDLTTPFKDSKTNPGARVYVIGVVKEVPIKSARGGESVNYDIVIEGNYIDVEEKDYSEIEISKDEEKEIKELARRDDVIDVLVKNMAPAIFGYNRIKEAILLQLFGGNGGFKGEGIKTRGDIHILLLGDPGAAKSQLLKAASTIAPKSIFVSGKSATGVGLTASVVRDELTGSWALEAGAIVLASGGLLAIDEMDKMSEDDVSAMHEALEQQSISIAKANIRATLNCPTTVLGAANPKFGRFDPYVDILKQIDFPPALISRFDLIFIIRDIPNKKKDSLIASHILTVHKDRDMAIPEIDSDFLKKYIAYAKKNIRPVLTNDAIEVIKNFYVKIRNIVGEDEENSVKAVPITARQLEAIVRMSEAYAKIRLDKKVRKEYAEMAINMMLYYLEKVGVDPKTGNIDIDKIMTGVSHTLRNAIRIIQNIIDDLEIKNPEILISDVVNVAKSVHNIEEKDTKEVINRLINDGIIFEPKKGIIKKLL